MKQRLLFGALAAASFVLACGLVLAANHWESKRKLTPRSAAASSQAIPAQKPHPSDHDENSRIETFD